MTTKLRTAVTRLEDHVLTRPLDLRLALTRLGDPGQSAELFRALLEDQPVENFVAVGLDARHRYLANWLVSVGTLTTSLVHPREVFGPALRLGNVAAIIVAHNHPSGDPGPSTEDLAVTRRLAEAGKLLGLPLLDSIIMGYGDWTSIRQVDTGIFD